MTTTTTYQLHSQSGPTYYSPTYYKSLDAAIRARETAERRCGDYRVGLTITKVGGKLSAGEAEEIRAARIAECRSLGL